MVCTLVVNLHVNDESSSIPKMKEILAKASSIYSKDDETLSWFVMQSTSSPRSFTIVERYQQKSSINIHRANPFYKEFGELVKPLMDEPIKLEMNEEDGDDWKGIGSSL